MLIMFKVKNYTSFKDDVILDFRATASGKSNLISAMFFFKQYIFGQFITKKQNEIVDIVEQNQKTKLEPFLLANQTNNASEFDIIFIHNGKQIQYGFECNTDEVFNEWYYIDDKKVFEREGNSVTFGNNYQTKLKSYTKVPNERLYLSVLDYFMEKQDKDEILGDFIEFFNDIYNVCFEIFFEFSVKKVGGLIMRNGACHLT